MDKVMGTTILTSKVATIKNRDLRREAQAYLTAYEEGRTPYNYALADIEEIRKLDKQKS
jgi:hypothetical protein